MPMPINEALSKINAKLKVIDQVPAGIGSKGEWGFDVDAVRVVVGNCENYKSYFDSVSPLPNCNGCGNKNVCKYVPKLGAMTRINCPFWAGMNPAGEVR